MGYLPPTDPLGLRLVILKVMRTFNADKKSTFWYFKFTVQLTEWKSTFEAVAVFKKNQGGTAVVISKNFSKGRSRCNHAQILGVA